MVLPTKAEPLAVSVKVEAEVAGFGVNEAVTPAGRPEAERLTFPVNPLLGFTVTMLVLVDP